MGWGGDDNVQVRSKTDFSIDHQTTAGITETKSAGTTESESAGTTEALPLHRSRASRHFATGHVTNPLIKSMQVFQSHVYTSPMALCHANF